MNNNAEYSKLLKEIKNEIISLKEGQKEDRAKLLEIKMGLVGSKQVGVEGVVQKCNRNTEYIEKDKKFKNKLVGGFAVIGFIFAGALTALWAKLINGIK